VTRLRRLFALDDPAETIFFLFLAVFATGIGVIYWVVAREPVGTILLVGFGVATGVLGLRLHVDPAARQAREAARTAPGTAAAGAERPFLDESGRLPDEGLAPLAVGAGVALIALGGIFGFAPIAVGVLPLAWGAWTWLAAARAELDAQSRTDDPGSRDTK